MPYLSLRPLPVCPSLKTSVSAPRGRGCIFPSGMPSALNSSSISTLMGRIRSDLLSMTLTSRRCMSL